MYRTYFSDKLRSIVFGNVTNITNNVFYKYQFYTIIDKIIILDSKNFDLLMKHISYTKKIY